MPVLTSTNHGHYYARFLWIQQNRGNQVVVVIPNIKINTLYVSLYAIDEKPCLARKVLIVFLKVLKNVKIVVVCTKLNH